MGSSSKRAWKKGRSLLQASRDSIPEENTAAVAASANLSAASRSTKKLVNTSTNANAKFIPTATRAAN